MRLPQDRILHIDTELEGGKMNIVAEWQGELVRCKDCKHQEHCHETVAHTRLHDGFKEYWSEPIEWCSRASAKAVQNDRHKK